MTTPHVDELDPRAVEILLGRLRAYDLPETAASVSVLITALAAEQERVRRVEALAREWAAAEIVTYTDEGPSVSVAAGTLRREAAPALLAALAGEGAADQPQPRTCRCADDAAVCPEHGCSV